MSPAGPGRLYQVAERQRAALLRGERQAASELVRAYGGVWQRIQARLDALWQAKAAAEADGLAVGDSWLYQFNRLDTLQRQVEAELRMFVEFADPLITRQQGVAVDAALQHSEELVRTLTSQAGVSVGWARLPTSAIEDLIGFTADGSPLRELLDALGPAASSSVRAALIQGLALGRGPAAVAREIRQALGGNVARALTISRTETLRAYREATRRSYEVNSDVVDGWIWNCACTERSCAMCWAMHGSVHPHSESLNDHPNGRCSMLPHVKDFPGMAPQALPEAGPAQFARLTPAQQDGILGKAAGRAYRGGAFKLEDVVGRTFDPDWGPGFRVKSLRELVGQEEAEKWRRAEAKPLKLMQNNAPGKNVASIPPINRQSVQAAEVWAREHIADQVDFSQAADLQSVETVSEVAKEFREKYGLQKLEGLQFDASEQWRDNGKTLPNRRWDNATVKIGLQTDTTRDMARLQSHVRTIEEAQASQGPTALSNELLQMYTDQVKAVQEGRFDFYGVHSEYAFSDLYEATARHEFSHAWHIQHEDAIFERLGYAVDDVAPAEFLKKYGVTWRARDNFAECVAENFALYSAGLRDRIHPDLLKLFEELIR